MGRFVDTSRILRDLGVGLALSERWMLRLERLLGIDRLDHVCLAAGVTLANADVAQQIRDVFAQAGIDYAVREVGNAGPDAWCGPLIFFCNHPFGIADALIALEYALGRRPDTKVLANNMLWAFDLNEERIIWIDAFPDPSGSSVNKRGLRQAMKHLRAGGALLIFASGACSHLHLWPPRITDPPWSGHLSRLIAGSNAACVPIYFAGHNSWRFQALGLIHPFLRTAMLVREFVGLKRSRVLAVVGSTIPRGELRGLDNTDAVTRHLRNTVYSLARESLVRTTDPLPPPTLRDEG